MKASRNRARIFYLEKRIAAKNSQVKEVKSK